MPFDHNYLAQLGVPRALLPEAGAGLCSLPTDQRNAIYDHLFHSRVLQAEFNRIARSFNFSEETKAEIWAAGFSKLLQKNKPFISQSYLFGEPGKNNGIFIGLMLAEARARTTARTVLQSLDQPFLATEGVTTLGDSLASPANQDSLEDLDFANKVKALIGIRRKDSISMYQRVYFWTFIHWLPPEELANKLSCTVATAKSRRNRLRDMLAEMLVMDHPSLRRFLIKQGADNAE